MKFDHSLSDMSILSAPDQSCVLVIDALRQNAAHTPATEAGKLAQRFSLLGHAADYLRIPRLFACPSSRPSTPDWLQQPCERNAKRMFRWPTGGSPWSNQQLVEAIHKEDRSCLFVCGFWLDDAVSFTALSALAEGYDTFLLTDMSVAYSKDARQPILTRLVQAGVVPTTLRQATSEWMSEIHDQHVRTELNKLITTSPD